MVLVTVAHPASRNFRIGGNRGYACFDHGLQEPFIGRGGPVRARRLERGHWSWWMD
ncbi:hypothetical protein ACFFX0_23395 [Citricoccus parietis]|uniref:Uncharacterized protein n=1 Tax=Citricoccus parietis TaxID=592307 RepID=A0ABV5G4W2_9MICC